VQPMVQGALAGQRRFRFPQLLAPLHTTSQAPVSAQRISVLPHDDTPQSTRQRMPGGQSMRVPPHPVTPRQLIRHRSPTQPSLQIAGHFSGVLVTPGGHVGAVSVFGGVVSGLAVSSTAAVSADVSSAGCDVSSVAVVAVSPMLLGSSSTDAASEPPQPAARAVRKQRAARMLRSWHATRALDYGGPRMVINPIATGAVYLALALPPTAFAVRYTRRPWAAGLFGAVVGMGLAVLLNPWLPFNFWAHARDFIIEPFLEKKMFRRPMEGALTLLFHVGVPVVFAMVLYRVRPPDLD